MTGQFAWREIPSGLGQPPRPAETANAVTVTLPPWIVDRAATAAMQADVNRVWDVAGRQTELSWVLQTDFAGMRFHAPRLAYCGAEQQTRFVLDDLEPGVLLVHNHPRESDTATPSEADLAAFDGYLERVHTLGFGIANGDITRLYLVRPPLRPNGSSPPRWRWWRSSPKCWRLGTWLLMNTGREK